MSRYVVYNKNFSLLDWFGLGGKKSIPPPPTSGSQNKELTLSIWGKPVNLTVETGSVFDYSTNTWQHDLPLTKLQKKLLDSFLSNHASILDAARKKVEDYCADRDGEHSLDLKNIHSYVQPTWLYVPSDSYLNQGRGIVLMCETTPDEEHGMGIEFSPRGKVMRIRGIGDFY